MPDATAILAQWEAICEAATKPPWDEDGDGVTAGDDAIACCIERSADMQFIAAARTGWLATIRALEVAREKLRHVEQVIGYSVGADEIDRILEGREHD